MKKLNSKKLVHFLMDHKKIEMITVTRRYIVAQCKKSFMPEDVKPLQEQTGYSHLRFTTSDGVNQIIFTL